MLSSSASTSRSNSVCDAHIARAIGCIPMFLMLGFLLPCAVQHAAAQVNVITHHNDTYRTGQNTAETILTPANVNMNTFGKLFTQVVDGDVYAQPLYLANVNIPKKGKHNVLYVATSHDSVYAFDADSNAGGKALPLWKVSFLKGSGISTITSADVNCTDMLEMGITSTPVIDTTTGTMYLLSVVKNKGVAQQWLHAIDVTSGVEKFGGPVAISGSVPGTGDGSVDGVLTFDPLRDRQRSSLLLQNGSIYIGWASYCDQDPWHGWVMAYSAANLQQQGIWNSTPNGGRGGVWQGGAGLGADSGGNIYVATGNGTFDNDVSGRDFGDSSVKLSLTGSGLGLIDYFTPYNQQMLAMGDVDIGSSGVLLIPDLPKNSAYQHLMIQTGKEGSIYVIDRDDMGGFNSGSNNEIVQFLPTVVGGVGGVGAFWNNNIYISGAFDRLRSFAFDPGTGLLSGGTKGSSTFYRVPGSTPSISANGTTNGIVWTVQSDGTGPGGSSILHAYDATNITKELFNSTQNATRDGLTVADKFATPTITNGKIYVGSQKALTVFGLLP
jgi:hypothetical protein